MNGLYSLPGGSGQPGECVNFVTKGVRSLPIEDRVWVGEKNAPGIFSGEDAVENEVTPFPVPSRMGIYAECPVGKRVGDRADSQEAFLASG